MKTAAQLIENKKHKEVISIAPHRPVIDALIILAEYKIGALVVMEKEKMVGIFSERDYAREVVLKGKSSKVTTIEEVMTKNVLVGHAKDTFEKAMTIMTENHIRHLPIMDGHQVIGMLSLGDVAKEMIVYQRNLIKELESYVKQ
ncbi:MAG: CBS domain-containing protein [Chitinophagia bacterium]|jgi:CBS domain-containing protein|nr:CBS domain-containing protein [Chitinophagia bacterium]